MSKTCEEAHHPQTNNVSMALNFVLGGISGCVATMLIQPIDMIKVRIQVLSEMGHKNIQVMKITKDLIRDQGVLYLYKGLDSALLRQVLYGTTRLGLFYSILDMIRKRRKEPTMIQKSTVSFLSGAVASLIASPADLILVRMQADGTLPPEERRNYQNVFDGIRKVIKQEGIKKLWTGCLPSLTRAAVMNLANLAPFEECKERLKNIIPNVAYRTVVSSMIASFFAALSSLPFDNAKTKLQKMKPDENGILPYKGLFDCMMKTAKLEGYSKLWVGFPTFYLRIGPHVIASLLINDFLRNKLKNRKK
jgi:solute carrier family 25 (mitochondrial oxoglutarate transporter), member 11